MYKHINKECLKQNYTIIISGEARNFFQEEVKLNIKKLFMSYPKPKQLHNVSNLCSRLIQKDWGVKGLNSKICGGQ